LIQPCGDKAAAATLARSKRTSGDLDCLGHRCESP
jgi:hypothetical protein